MKIVINPWHGGFSLDEASLRRLRELGSPEALTISDDDLQWGRYDYDRTDPALIQLVEEQGDDSDLRVVDVPDDVEWEIQEYDGAEWIAEKHRTWR